MPVRKLTAADLDWFDLRRYAPLRNAPDTRVIQAIRDRRLLATYVINSSFFGTLPPDIARLAPELRQETVLMPMLEPMLERLQVDPLSPLFDLEGRYPTLLATPSSVSLLDVETVRLMARHLRANPRAGNEPWNVASGDIPSALAYLQIDMRASDRQILYDLNKQLKAARGSFAVKVSNRSLSKKLRVWAGSGVFPLIDLELFRLVRQQEDLAATAATIPPSITALTLPKSLVLAHLFPGLTEDQQQAAYENAGNHKDEILKNPYLLQTLAYPMG